MLGSLRLSTGTKQISPQTAIPTLSKKIFAEALETTYVPHLLGR